MTFLVADRVQETTNSPGTGVATLLGAVSGYQSFSTGIGANNTTFYVIADQLGTNWEVGLGALNSTGTVLTRTTVYSSSNGGSTVNFATGTQYVWCDYPSSKAVIQGLAVNFSSIGATTAGTGAFTTLSASSTVGGAGFSNYFAAPPTIGNTTPNAGTFTALVATSITDSGLTAGRVNYNGVGGLLTDSANMTFDGTKLTLANDASISGLTVGKGGGAVAQNTVFGISAMATTATGNNNAVFGYQAGNAITSGDNNTFLGTQAGLGATTSSGSTGIGSAALYANTTGNYNVAIGQQALRFNTTGSNNTAVGYQAGYSNTTGLITAFGKQAGYGNTTGTDNCAIGDRAFYTNTTGISNSALGTTALYFNTTGSYNTAIGTSALQANTTANGNTAVGYQAGLSCTTGGVTAFGYQALQSITTNGICAAFGYQALLNTTGIRNTGIGHQAGINISTGTCNTALGSSSLNGPCTGSDNIAIGSWHDGVIEGPLSAITSGGANLAVGNGSLRYLTTGASNTALGYSTGAGVTTASSCILIGAYANVSGAGNTNEIVIGVSGSGKGSNTGYIYPNGGGVYQGNNSATWSITSDQRLKKNIVDNTVGLDAISKIQVRNFEYRLPEEVTELESQNAIDIKGIQLGPIAQELQTVLPDCVKTESTGVLSVDSSPVVWYLVNAVKELNAKVTALETQLGAK